MTWGDGELYAGLLPDWFGVTEGEPEQVRIPALVTRFPLGIHPRSPIEVVLGDQLAMMPGGAGRTRVAKRSRWGGHRGFPRLVTRSMGLDTGIASELCSGGMLPLCEARNTRNGTVDRGVS